eukprot:s1268_g3.t1
MKFRLLRSCRQQRRDSRWPKSGLYRHRDAIVLTTTLACCRRQGAVGKAVIEAPADIRFAAKWGAGGPRLGQGGLSSPPERRSHVLF